MSRNDKITLTLAAIYFAGFVGLSGYFYNGSCIGLDDPDHPTRGMCTLAQMLVWPIAAPINLSIHKLAP